MTNPGQPYNKPDIDDVFYIVHPLDAIGYNGRVSRVGKTLFDVEIEDDRSPHETITFRCATRREKPRLQDKIYYRRALTSEEYAIHMKECERRDRKNAIFDAAYRWKYSNGTLTNNLEDLREACRLLGIEEEKTT